MVLVGRSLPQNEKTIRLSLQKRGLLAKTNTLSLRSSADASFSYPKHSVALTRIDDDRVVSSALSVFTAGDETMPLDREKFALNDAKLPLAMSLYYNWFFSPVFAFGVGWLAFEKRLYARFESDLQRSLLLPVYLTWALAEAARLYSGQRGVLLGRVPELTAFAFLCCFPQLFTVLFVAYLQERLEPLDRVLGGAMLLVISIQAAMALRLQRYIAQHPTTGSPPAKEGLRFEESSSARGRPCELG